MLNAANIADMKCGLVVAGMWLADFIGNVKIRNAAEPYGNTIQLLPQSHLFLPRLWINFDKKGKKYGK